MTAARRSVLVLRPEPGASATLARARALGLRGVAAPLFAVRAVAWEPPPPNVAAVIMTSANAARLGGGGLAALRALPLYAVGAATAGAARASGFARVIAGDDDAAALIARAAADGVTRLLHLAGRDHREAAHPGVAIVTRTVYASDAVDALPDIAAGALREGAVALLHSPRAAALFARLIDAAGVDAAGVRIAALSQAVLSAAGDGWGASAVARSPTDDALLAAAVRLCDQAPCRRDD